MKTGNRMLRDILGPNSEEVMEGCRKQHRVELCFVISAKNHSADQIKMGERGRVVLHVLGRSSDRFRWGNSAEGEHFKELGTAWKKISPALDLLS
jgi:hypothetical protein